MLPKGCERKDPHDYRHARGCPEASPSERRLTALAWSMEGEPAPSVLAWDR
jgi:hypothetical protein